MRLTRYFAAKVIAVVSLSLAAFAQQYPPQQPPQQQQQADDSFDPDSVNRGVARISVMNGDVSVQRGDSGEVVAAALDAPLVVGDRVLTGPNSRAEVQFDSANMIRVAADSEVRLAEVADHRYQIQLARGMATFRVLRASDSDVEVSTPQVSIRPRKEGVYRMLVRDENESEVTVRAGEVEVFTPRGVETLRAGRTMQVRGSASDPEYQIISATGEDEWDHWNRNRDQDLQQRSASYRYVGPDVAGAEDLDNNGQWVNDPAYGEVWAPRVAAGWAPYQEGRWVWTDWYGWTWVSYDPWGWAPYHYGRWYQSASFGWCWYPGAFRSRHYWSPGLVAFVGFGGGGGIGWVPLAPYERYNRWYGRGFYGGNRGFGANLVSVNVYNTYRNARVVNGVSAIDTAKFGRGGSGRPWRATDGDLQRVSLVRGQLPVAPARESLRLTDRDARSVAVSRSTANERFVSRRQPTQVERVPFEQQRRNFEQSRVGGSGLTPSVQGQSTQSTGAWRRFGEPSTGATGGNPPAARIQPSGGATNSQRGWSGFGAPGAPVERGAARQTPAQPQVQRPASPGPQRQMNKPSGFRSSSPEPVRISPPVVRERPMSRPASPPPARSNPRSESPRPSGGNSGGGGHGDSHGDRHR